MLKGDADLTQAAEARTSLPASTVDPRSTDPQRRYS